MKNALFVLCWCFLFNQSFGQIEGTFYGDTFDKHSKPMSPGTDCGALWGLYIKKICFFADGTYCYNRFHKYINDEYRIYTVNEKGEEWEVRINRGIYTLSGDTIHLQSTLHNRDILRISTSTNDTPDSVFIQTDLKFTPYPIHRITINNTMEYEDTSNNKRKGIKPIPNIIAIKKEQLKHLSVGYLIANNASQGYVTKDILWNNSNVINISYDSTHDPDRYMIINELWRYSTDTINQIKHEEIPLVRTSTEKCIMN